MKKFRLVLLLVLVALMISMLAGCDFFKGPQSSNDEFVITFDTQGGSEIAPITIRSGESLTLPKAPTKDGYVFDGWYLDSNCIEAYEDSYVVSKNITLYAKWRELVAGEEFNVTFNLNYGTDNIVEKTTENRLITYIPVRQGYRFNGWYYSDGYVEDIGYILTEKYDTTIPVTQNGLVLYAEWVDSSTDSRQLASPTISVNGTVLSWNTVQNAEKYEFKFYLGNNLIKTYYTTQSSINIDSIGIDAGTYTLKARSIGDGVSHINSAETIKHISYKVLLPVSNANIDVESSILTWTEANNAGTYTIYIDGTKFGRTSSNSLDLSKLNAGQYVIKIVAEKSGYTSSNATFTLVKSRLLTPTIKIERQPKDNYSSKISWGAIYNANQYVVVVDKKEVATTSNNYYVLNDSDWGSNKKVSVSVYAKDSSADYLVSIPSEISTVTRTAKIVISHNITNASSVKVVGKSYNSADNLVEDYSSANDFYVGVDFGEPKKVVAVPQNGFTWLGWYDKSGKLISTKTEYIFNVDTPSSEIVAHWASYSVSLNKNNNNAGKIGFSTDDMSTQNTLSQRIVYGDEVTIYASTNNGYTWLGWYKGDEKVSDEQTYVFTMSDSNFAFTAKWSKTTISVSSSSAGSVSGLSSTYKVGDKVTVTATTNKGYTWDGWYLNGEKVSSDLQYEIQITEEPLNYVATWKYYTLTTSRNISAAGTISNYWNQKITVGDNVELVANTNKGYTWLGWYDGETLISSETTYNYIMSAESKTLIAKWTYYTLSTQTNDSEAGTYTVLSNKKVTVGDSIELVASTNDGYTWLGWYDGETLISSETTYNYIMSAESKTLIAKWTYYTLSTQTNDSEAGTYTVLSNKKVTVGDSIELVASTNDGYTWLGWYDGETMISSETTYTYIMPAESKTITAKWEIITYSITYSYTYETEFESVLKTSYTHKDSNIVLEMPNNGTYYVDYWYYSGEADTRITEIDISAKRDFVVVGHVASCGLRLSGSSIVGIGTCTQTELLFPRYNGKTEITQISENAFKDKSSITNAIIPDSVTSIAYQSFYNCRGLTSVTIGSGVTSISSSAFNNCYRLVEVYNKSSLTINSGSSDNGYVAYYAKNVYTTEGGSKLSTDENGYVIYTDGDEKILVAYTGSETELTLPADITQINKYAFYYCRKLKGITIPNSVTSIGNQAFNGCSGLTKIIGHANAVSAVAKQCTSKAFEVVVTGVTSIGESAFNDCIGLTSVTIGNEVTSIGSWAFYGCYRLIEVFNKSSLTINSGSSDNGYVAYYAKNVYTTEGGSKLSTDENGYVIYTDGDEKILVAYTGTETDFTLPSDITQILNYAFYNCSDLMSVTIPNSVTSIGNYAFSGCSRLTSITIPDSVTSIGDYAFRDCERLTSITIPNGVTSIGDGAFYLCSGLKSITIPNSVTSIGRIAFHNTSWYWKQPDGLVYAGKVAYKYKGTMPSNTSIVIKEGTLGIADTAFSGCSGLTSITIPNSVKRIGDFAFSGCTGLTSVTIGNSVTSIGECAFTNCIGLTSVTIGKGVTSIGTSAFKGCKGLTTVNWNATKCTSVGSYIFSIFEDCSNLETVNIGNNVKIIPPNAFYGCSKLQNIYITDIAAWCNISGLDNLMNYGSSNKNLYINNELATSITIQDGVTAIPEYAFKNCSGLTSVTIGNNVTSIGYSAFGGCTGLTSVTIGNSVTRIGSFAFYNSYKLIEVYNKSSLTITAGSSDKGYVAYYAKNVYTTEGGSKLSIDENGYVVYADGNEKILVAYTGSETELSLPSDITQINKGAFYECAGLTSVTIGSSVTSIGSSAFSGCSGLTSVTIPDSVTSIGDYAFSGCSGLTSITFNGTKAQWAAISKGGSWNRNTGSYTVYCTDGTLN